MAGNYPSVRRTAGGWEAMFVSEVVTMTRFDYATSILTENIDLRIEGPFELAPDGRPISLLHPGGAHGMEQVVALHGVPVRTIAISDSGHLAVTLERYRIEVAPGEQFEAYTLDVQPAWKFVATPGGGVAVWEPS